MEESLLKSNFLGRDGFRWWVGQIPPESAHGGQINGAGWGNRFKVRIMGYHPYNTVELPNEDLPWAQCLLPTTSGTGAGNNATTIKVSPGDSVFGFFLDGDNAQIPVIMGCFGRTSQVPSTDYAGPFQPFTGYTSKIKNDGTALKRDQTNEQNAKSQKSPRSVSPQQAEAIADDEISSFSAIGDKIQLANTVSNTIVNKISTEVGNLLNKVKAPAIFTDIANEITRVTDKIQAITNGLVGNMINGLYKGMIPILNRGLQLLYQSVYNIILAATGGNVAAAHLAGVAAQTAMVNPIKEVEEAMPCVAGAIISGLGGLIEEVLNSVVDNVQNFVSCAANQFTGVLVNDIIGKISSGLSASLGGIQRILEFIPSFSVDGFLRNSTDSIKGLVGLFDCNQTKGKSNGIVDEWIIGSGPANAPAPSFDEILENANTTNAIANSGDELGGVQGAIDGVAGAFSAINNIPNQIGGCYTGRPLFCSAPVVTVFGGGGSGATAIPLIGAISGSTGSIIGTKVTNGGSGYRFPPFVEIRDNCMQGYGAVARATINDAGEVDSIYIVSEGENYPTGDLYDNSVSTTADTVINSSTENQTQSLISRNYIVDKILIQNPGQNYIGGVGGVGGDTATDQFGNEYSIEIFEGSITKIQPINTTVIVNDLPIITIKSDTGSGAILRPILDIPPADFQGEVKQVIDCVT
jgi:hypothetical protein